MTWPMHDAGSTTPDPGPDDARRQEPSWPDEPPWPDEPRGQEPWPEEPEPGDGDPSRRGRHAAPDPLPPIEGPMPGGGPSPAETTLPLALKWPAPPTRPHRSPSPHRPARRSARLAPGAQDHRLPAARPGPAAPPAAHLHADANQAAGSARAPRTTRGPRRRPRGPQGPPGAGARHAGSPTPAPTQRSSLVRSSAGMAVGTLVSRATGFLRTLVLVYAVGIGAAR